MPTIIVTDVATADEEATEAALQDRGYRRRQVWIKEIAAAEMAEERFAVCSLGVGRFIAADAWGRSND
jgi:hypothetical protein